MGDFTLPTLLGGVPVHPCTAACYEMLGDAMTAGDDANGFLLLAFMDALVDGLKPVWDLVLANDTRPGWWDVFNPYALPGQVLPWLPWLVQFTGEFYDTSTFNLDIEAASPDQINRDKTARLRRWHRGEMAVIIDTIQERIPTGVTLTIAERVAGSVSHFSVTLYTSQAVTQAQLANIYQALAANTPAGDAVDMVVVTGASYSMISAPLATYAARTTTYPLYSSLPASTVAPYTGPLPIQVQPIPGTTDNLTWTYLETFIQTWTAIESYASWDALQSAGG